MTTGADKSRKIIHIDMDCFYAAVEIRDNPSLLGKPIAVGGPKAERGVICTGNYIARKYGIHSAMPTTTAYRLCPELILLPVDMAKYRAVSKEIHDIFRRYTHLVEPLALDEAYLDVTNTGHHQGSATLIAKAICSAIWESQKLTASAGIAPNKMLSKIASGWNKPNGIFLIRPGDIDNFIQKLPVKKLHGVGVVTTEKLKKMGVHTCADLQKISLVNLIDFFGKMGECLYNQCRGIDYREIKPNRVRKSLSVETTFAKDLNTLESCKQAMPEIYQRLINRLKISGTDLEVKNQYIKVKFHDFKQVTAELMAHKPELELYQALLEKIYLHHQKPIRLLGLGINFKTKDSQNSTIQMSLF